MRITLLTLALLAIATPARAASTGGVPGFLRAAALALAPDGSGLLVVEADRSDRASCRLPKSAGYVAVRAAGGALGPLRPVGGDVISAARRRPDGTFVVLLATSVKLSGECRPIRDVDLATLDAAGTVVARAPVARNVVLERTALGLDTDGTPVAVWSEVDGRHCALRVSRGGAPAVTLAEGDSTEPEEPFISDFELAASPDGQGLLLAWAEPKRVRALTIGGAIEEIGTADEVTTVHAGVARGGRAVIAWATQDGGE